MEEQKRQLFSMLDGFLPGDTESDAMKTVTLDEIELLIIIPIIFDAMASTKNAIDRKNYHSVLKKILESLTG